MMTLFRESQRRRYAASNSALCGPERSEDFLVTHRSQLRCIASQLSGERPSALESRETISGLTALPVATTCAIYTCSSVVVLIIQNIDLSGREFTW